MVKIISLIILLAGMVWTWSLFNSPTKMNTQIHAEIQSKLALLIEETIKNKKPNSSDFEMNQMYTSTINENLVSAHFSYKFKDQMDAGTPESEGVEQNISGYALLAKTPSENPDIQKWVVQSIKTNQESVSFNDGLVVTAGDSSSSEPTDNKTETPAQPEHK